MEDKSDSQINFSWLWLMFYFLVFWGLLFVILKVIHLYQKRQHMIKVLSYFPDPPRHWLYGHIHLLKPEEELLNGAALIEKYPYCHQIWLGDLLGLLLVNHPEYAKRVYNKSDSKPLIMYHNLIPWIGRGLLILNGPKWYQHRKLLTPGFHYEILKPYLALTVESVRVMLDKWEKLVPNGTTASLELFEHVSLMTLDSILKCAFSYHSNCQTDRYNSYINSVLDATCLISKRYRTPLYHSDFIYWWSSQGRQFRKACRLCHDHTDVKGPGFLKWPICPPLFYIDVVMAPPMGNLWEMHRAIQNKVIRERKESLKNEQELEKILKKRRLDFLDILLCTKDEHGNPLSDKDVRAEVDTFMFEGHDTTASGISWLLYCMAQNPEHQQRCREEIKELFEEKENIQWDDLAKMTYCTMCIKESLRLYPSVPYVARELNAPLTFPNGGNLPKGFTVMLNIYGLHRNPEIWDNPEVFNPLRFSPENSSTRHPYAFVPFAAGPRNCIGQQFAMNELKVALALTLLKFELFPDPSKPPFPSPQLVIRSLNGIHVNLKALC